MSDVLARTLTTKSVVGVDGIEFGTVHNITLEPSSGALVDLVVNPSPQSRSRSTGFDTDENGRLLIPVDRIRVVRDTIVVH